MSQRSVPLYDFATTLRLHLLLVLSCSQDLGLWVPSLQSTIFMFSLCSLLSKKQQKLLVFEVVALCSHGSTFNDNCNTLRIALFSAKSATVSFFITHAVDLVCTEELKEHSLWAIFRKR